MTPHRQQTALIVAVTAEDITAIVAALILRAKEGDVVAAREVLDRLLGRPVELDLIERLEHIEQELAKLEATP